MFVFNLSGLPPARVQLEQKAFLPFRFESGLTSSNVGWGCNQLITKFKVLKICNLINYFDLS